LTSEEQEVLDAIARHSDGKMVANVVFINEAAVPPPPVGRLPMKQRDVSGPSGKAGGAGEQTEPANPEPPTLRTVFPPFPTPSFGYKIDVQEKTKTYSPIDIHVQNVDEILNSLEDKCLIASYKERIYFGEKPKLLMGRMVKPVLIQGESRIPSLNTFTLCASASRHRG